MYMIIMCHKFTVVHTKYILVLIVFQFPHQDNSGQGLVDG